MTAPVAGQPHQPHQVRGVQALPIPAGQGTGVIMAGDLRLLGWSLVETTGAAPAQVDLVDGSAGSGVTLAVISLAAGSAATKGLWARGIQVETQLALVVNAGSVRGAVYVADN